MRFLATTLLSCALLAAACGPRAEPPAGDAPDIELVLDWNPESSWQASLVNRGDETHDVVLLGDGSDRELRSPIVRWEVVAEDGPLSQSRGGCGNYNPLEPDEVVALAPGESVSLNRYGFPYLHLPEPCRATVALTYEHDPELEWSSGELGAHDAATMARVRTAEPLLLRSNALRVERDADGTLRVLDR